MLQRLHSAPRGARVSLVAACLAAVALVASACQPKATAIGQNDVNPVDAGTLVKGGTLNWPISTFPSNYNGNQSSGAGGDEAAILNAMMPTMFTFDAAGQPVLDSYYLSAATVTSTNPMVVTYEINPKAFWNNGSPIVAADFQAQWQALNGKDSDYNTAGTAGYSDVSSVIQGSSPREVVVTFTTPFADWRGLFSPLYPASLNSTPAEFNQGWLTGTATSAGPFMFQGFDPTAQTVTIVRDPKWWGPAPVLSSIVFHALGSDPAAALAALRSGQVDFASIEADTSQLATGKAIKNTVVRTAAGSKFRQVTLNGAPSSPLNDIRVRQAVALTIDRAKIAQRLLSPLGVPDQDLNNHIYLADEQGYQDNAGVYDMVDTSKAASLLSQAGWKLVKGQRVSASGQPLQLRLLIPQGVPQATQESSLIKSMLGAVGIQVLVLSEPNSSFFQHYIFPGDFDLALFSWQGSVFPITATRAIYQSPTATATTGASENYADLSSPAIDSLYAQASMELNAAASIRLGNEIDVKVWQELASLTLYQEPDIVIERSNLANFGAFGLASTNYLTIGFTK
ncbi:MAG TPA: ABC transporter family substrate-binding protein [Actinomycetota bacterium]|nr:ABC transporter family substrate-binding protein [Actinomycetota bacterium]